MHHVKSRGLDFFYFQAGRGTKAAGPRTRLPNDPQSPEFWVAVRKASGEPFGIVTTTVGAVIDLYLVSPQFGKLAASSQAQYRRHLEIARKAWGNLPAAGLRPWHTRELLDGLGEVPGTANLLLGVLRALSAWGVERHQFEMSVTKDVAPYETDGGHKPWTAEQCAAAEKHFTGLLRRAYFLARHTGQRGSDIIRLGETYVDDGGFRLGPKKTVRRIGDIWIPIEPELAAEMATWERRPGPYVPLSKKMLEREFRARCEDVPELVEATFHGLRGTRVIELRERGANTLEVSAQVGMSPQMIEHYCRFADKKALGKAAVINLEKARKGK